jgi:hypothetical protein
LFDTALVLNTPKKKKNLLPFLTVLFIFSYGLMTLLIVEQGATIQSQSNLIKVLMPDSRELWGLKGKAITERQNAKAQAQTHGQVPPAQSRSNPANPSQGSAAQSGSQSNAAHAGKTAKPQTQFPPIPASDLDPRRSVRTI